MNRYVHYHCEQEDRAPPSEAPTTKDVYAGKGTFQIGTASADAMAIKRPHGTMMPPVSPEQGVRKKYPRRNAFCHASLLKSAVLASIESSESLSFDSESSHMCPRNDGIADSEGYNLNTHTPSKSAPKKSRRISDMEEDLLVAGGEALSLCEDEKPTPRRVVSRRNIFERSPSTRSAFERSPSTTSMDF